MLIFRVPERLLSAYDRKAGHLCQNKFGFVGAEKGRTLVGMKTKIGIFSTCLLLLFAAGARNTLGGESDEGAPVPPRGLEDVPVVAAMVGSKPITRNALLRELVGSAGSAALDRLIRRMLVEQAAEMMRVTVTTEECEQQARLDALALENELVRAPWILEKPTPAEIIRANFGMSWEEYKKLVVRQRLSARRCVARDIEPSESDLREFFRRHRDTFQPPDRFRAAHILFTPLSPGDLWNSPSFQSRVAREGKRRAVRERWRTLHGVEVEAVGGEPEIVKQAWEKSRLQAERVAVALRAGRVGWEEAVHRWSRDPLDRWTRDKSGRQVPPLRQRKGLQPGEVGWFTERGPFVAEFSAAAAKLAVGEIGGPVRTRYGWHLIKMLEIRRAKKVSFSEVRKKVKQAYLENEIRLRSEAWLDELVRSAVLKTTSNLLWPPRPGSEPPGADPAVGTINGRILYRSAVWRELLRSDGAEALDRLVNRELILGPLRRMGPRRVEWFGAPPALRSRRPPPENPVALPTGAVDLALNDDRLAYDSLRESAPRKAPASFAEYLYARYGQSESDYRRALEAGLVLKAAVRRKIHPDDATLRLQYALARDNYRKPTLFEVSHLLLIPEGGMARASEADRIKTVFQARRIVAEYKRAPEKFAELVARYSQAPPEDKARGGRLGLLTPSGGSPGASVSRESPEETAERCYLAKLYHELLIRGLKTGQLSGPVRTKRGYELLRVDRRREGGKAPDFESVKERVKRDYLAAKAKIYTDLWLRTLPSLVRIRRFIFPKRRLAVPADKPLLPPK